MGVNGDAKPWRTRHNHLAFDARAEPPHEKGGEARAGGQDARRTQPGGPCPGTADFAAGMPPGRARPYPAGAQRPARPAACPLLERLTAGLFTKQRDSDSPEASELSPRTVLPRQRVLPAARPPFSSQWSVVSGQRRRGHFTSYCALAAIAVELVTGLGVVSVRVVVTIAGDVAPGRPGRSPAGGPTEQLGVAVGRGGGGRRRWPARCRPSERPGRRTNPPAVGRALAAEQRAGHDGPAARAGRTPALRGGREAGPRTGRRGCSG